MIADLSIWSDPIQAGFAAMCVCLLGVVIWLVRVVVSLSRSTQTVVSANTEAITRLVAAGNRSARIARETLREVTRLRFDLARRPCMVQIDGEEDGGQENSEEDEQDEVDDEAERIGADGRGPPCG